MVRTFKKVVGVKVDVQKGALRFREILDNKCVSFHPMHVSIHICHMVTVLNDHLVHSCWGLHLGSRVLQTGGFGSARGLS